MPNHIKNRIELNGSKDQINLLIAKYSTTYPKTPNLAHDGTLIFVNKETNSVGWLNESTGVFNRRDEKDVIGIPDGFEQDFNEEWTRFPDFNKIVPMPQGMEVSPHSGIETWVEICTHQVNLKKLFGGRMSLGNDIDNLLDSMSASTAMETIMGERNRKSVKDFTDEDFDTFVQCLKNYRNHGYMSWYKWSIDNWGTKWNAYSCKKISDSIFDFDTAWSSVPDLVIKMSEAFPDLEISYKYSDEDSGSNCGYAVFKNGIGEVVQLKNSSKEAYDMYFELRPEEKENYRLIGDKYEYIDEE